MTMQRTLPPTRGQLRTLAAIGRTGGQKGASGELRVSLQTVKNQMSELYDRLGVGGAVEAFVAVGWLHIPGDPTLPCGWVGACTRSSGHRGQHGSFRPLPDDGAGWCNPGLGKGALTGAPVGLPTRTASPFVNAVSVP